jgi:hypothetical protein
MCLNACSATSDRQTARHATVINDTPPMIAARNRSFQSIIFSHCPLPHCPSLRIVDGDLQREPAD